MMQNPLPKRKNLRLQDFDYSQNGCYFITICTKDKKNLFGSRNVGAIHESPAVKMPQDRFINLNFYGTIVESEIKHLAERYPYISVDNYIVMPNHIHLIITVNYDEKRAIRESPLRRSLISQAIGYLKASVSKELHKYQPNQEIWQRGYYDHIVRNQEDFENIWNYIEYNALKEYSK